MQKLINKHIMEEDYNMELVLAAHSPSEVLDYLKQHTSKSGLYFLDVDLQHELNGIELGAKIRELDVSATIAFITTRSEMAHLVFMHKVEAMDYIIKDDPDTVETGVKTCMQLAYQRYLSGKHAQDQYFTVKSDDHIWNIPHDDILFFETDFTQHKKLVLHTETGLIGFRSSISEVENIGPEFYCCHRSFVINLKKVKRIDRAKREIEMTDGKIIPVAARKMTEFLKRMG